MKICIISREDIDIFSPKEGASVKIYYTMKELSNLGNEVFFVSGNNNNYYRMKGGEKEVIEYPKFLQKIFNKRESSKELMFKLGIPMNFVNLYHPCVNFNMWLRTLYVTLREEVDILQAEFPAFSFPALFTKFFTGTKVSVVEHNIEYFQIQQISNDLPRGGKKIIRAVEQIAGKLSDYLITVSDEDEKRLEKIGIDTDKVIPHGVDIDRFQDSDPERIKEKYGINEDEKILIFHGVLNYEPNEEATKIIVDDILPDLRKTDLKFKILIVGGHPPKINEEEIITTGFVDKLEDYVNAADLAIVPLKSGGGTRMKILEYFASRIPVISTKKGMEGLDIEDGKHLIISNIENFSSEINELIHNDELEKKIAKNGFDFIKNLDWKNIAQNYTKLYEDG
ncbi:MAG: glycosyltransferase family 4 protein [Candidatus Aenigmatarchaeota archaeon]